MKTLRSATKALRPGREKDRRRRMMGVKYTRGFLDALFGQEMHAARVQSLASGVVGVLAAGVVSIHAIGQAYALVAGITGKSGIKQIDVKRVVQSTLDKITEYLAAGQTVELRNFGIFKIKSRRGRLGRNPRTGQEVPVPPKKVVVFKPGLIMKRDVK